MAPLQLSPAEDFYFPESCTFADMESIPHKLLAAVAECYSNRRSVCRVCYFSQNGKSQTLSPRVSNACEKGHFWKPLCVVPCCKMCAGPSEWVAIFPAPQHMQSLTTPFTMCNKKDGHRSCFDMARSQNPWFPHTVEEMVIWTVERYTGGHWVGVR